MPPYSSLLVLALAASFVTPVLSAEAAQPLGQNEERSLRHFQLVERGKPAIGNKKYWVWGIRFAVLSVLMADGVYLYKSTLGKNPNGDATNTSIPTGQTNSTSAAPARRNERPFGRGLPMDDSDARSFLDKSNQKRRTSQQLDLLSRTEFGEALSLIGRMLREDELD